MTEATLNAEDILNEPISTEPTAQAPVEETPAEPQAEASDDRPRDEKGRFKPTKEGGETPAASVVAEAQPVETPKEDKPDHIPSWRLKEEADARRELQRERDELRQQLWAFQQHMQQLQQANQPKPEPIDIFTDPNAYQAHVEQTMEQRLKAMEGNFSLRLAAYKHGDTFTEAWGEMMSRTQMGDDSLRQQVLQSPDPGETLVQLYQREKVVKEVGTDPTAYRSKVLDEALNDPQFLAKALERAKGVAGTNTTQKIELPPSLNKVAAAASAHDLDDMSDAGIFARAMRR